MDKKSPLRIAKNNLPTPPVRIGGKTILLSYYYNYKLPEKKTLFINIF
jgi:hypothetical protein